MKKAVLFFYLTCCSFLFACDKEENTVKPVNSKPTIPVIIPDVETISATIEADGSMRLTGKINKIDPNALDYGFIATQDSLFGPVWKIVGMNSKPVTGTYSLNIKNDTRFEKVRSTTSRPQ